MDSPDARRALVSIQRAIAVMTVWTSRPPTEGPERARELLRECIAEGDSPEDLGEGFGNLAAILLRDLASATDAQPNEILQHYAVQISRDLDS